MIHSPFGVCLARSPMRRANSSGLVASFNCTASRARPPLTKCTCESLKPGRSSLPSASITRVLGPRQLSTSELEPTATMRSPRTATACAVGLDLSTVQTFALVMMRSAAGRDWAAAGCGEIQAGTENRGREKGFILCWLVLATGERGRPPSRIWVFLFSHFHFGARHAEKGTVECY